MRRLGLHTEEFGVRYGSFAQIAAKANDDVRDTIESLVEAQRDLFSFSREARLEIADFQQRVLTLEEERAALVRQRAAVEAQSAEQQRRSTLGISTQALSGATSAARDALNAQIAGIDLQLEEANALLTHALVTGADSIQQGGFAITDNLQDLSGRVVEILTGFQSQVDAVRLGPDLGENQIRFGEFGRAATVFGQLVMCLQRSTGMLRMASR